MVKLVNLQKEILKAQDKKKAKILAGFFKTAKGQYGEGDVFLGLTVPKQREIAKRYLDLTLSQIQKLLNSKYHEFRLCALLILIAKYAKSDEKTKAKIVSFYLKNTQRINNWDLVDLSAEYILGSYLLERNKSPLYRLAKSKNLWEKRIAIIATFFFIRRNQFTDTFKIAKMLLSDKHDLIHKACGWMLREVGKKDEEVLIEFLNTYKSKLPRTTLRYAIERLTLEQRTEYLKK